VNIYSIRSKFESVIIETGEASYKLYNKTDSG